MTTKTTATSTASNEPTTTITDAQQKLADAVISALTDECSDSGCEILPPRNPGDHPHISCWASEADRDLAWMPQTAVNLVDEMDDVEGVGKVSITHISAHETLSDGEIEYNNLYLLQPFNTTLLIWGSLGEFVDDNYDFYFNGKMSFYDSEEAAIAAIHETQKNLALDAFTTGVRMGLAALSSVDDSIRQETMGQMRKKAAELVREWKQQEQRAAA